MKIILLGPNGYIGSSLFNFLKQKNIKTIPISREDCNLLNKDNFYKIIKKNNPNYIINCAGYTGKPNVDACESNKEKCWKGNVTIPKYLSDIASYLNIKYIQLSSGCIYSGKKNDSGFTEEDEPNFSFDHQPCSFYSGTKAVMEDILKHDKNAYICRLRIPFNEVSNPRNYITKIINYNKLLNVENSLTNLNDFNEACLFLLKNNINTGIYNIINTGSITTEEITKLISKYIINKKFKFFKNENEFYKHSAITPRSNCVLNNNKIKKAGFKISTIKESIEYSLKNYK